MTSSASIGRTAPTGLGQIPIEQCPVCLRQSRGFGFRDPTLPGAPYFEACCLAHLETAIHHWRTGQVLEPMKYERIALDLASDKAGEYLEGIGKTDLATLTGEEWHGLLALIYATTSEAVGRLIEENAVPF